MVKTGMTGLPGTESDQGQAEKRDDYRAPKLTVVGTVEDLTLGTGNEGNPDGAFQTQGGG